MKSRFTLLIKAFLRDVRAGEIILLDDGKIQMRVL